LFPIPVSMRVPSAPSTDARHSWPRVLCWTRCAVHRGQRPGLCHKAVTFCCTRGCSAPGQSRSSVDVASMSGLPPQADLSASITDSRSGCEAILSALALHRFVREPLELDRKWMSKAHLTLCHYQACGILFRRNPPLSACASAPKELASRILMVEG